MLFDTKLEKMINGLNHVVAFRANPPEMLHKIASQRTFASFFVDDYVRRGAWKKPNRLGTPQRPRQPLRREQRGGLLCGAFSWLAMLRFWRRASCMHPAVRPRSKILRSV
jgi:hypothetical protein